jgi:voltage-gated potassium channel Kch
VSEHHSFRARLRYRFDTALAAGTAAVILWLGVITATVVIVTGIIVSVTDMAIHHIEHPGIVESIWQNLLRSLEPAALENDVGWLLRLQSLFVVLFGILVGSSLIGLVASGIDRRVSELRKGRSQVLESGHTLVLGWSEKVFPVISELVIAHRGRRRSCIVILAPQDRVEMESEIRARIPDLGNTRVVCRSGDPSSRADLAMTSPYASRSVIVLGSNHDDGDAQAIRTVLALMDDARFPKLRVVADFLYPENAAALREATDGGAITIASSDIIARVTAQACRHGGLGAVFQELLDFEDVDVHFDAQPALVGRRFGDLVLSYDAASPIGIRTTKGTIQLNPPDDYVLAAGDETVVLALDSTSFKLQAEPDRPPELGPALETGVARPARILMVGWNPLAGRIVSELDKWVSPGSFLRVLVDEELVADNEVEVPGLGHLELRVTRTRNSSPCRVAELAAAEQYERVVVLCYRKGLTPEAADARALMTLLHLRQFRRTHPELSDHMSVVAEVLDIRDVELARVAGADDLIVSERLTALMLSQLAEIPEREKVFEDLFDVSGSDICTRHVAYYTEPQPGVPYAAYVAAAQRYGHLAIGYQSIGERTRCLADGIVLNPSKSKAVDFRPDDRLIVVVPHEPHTGVGLSTVPAPAVAAGSAGSEAGVGVGVEVEVEVATEHAAPNISAGPQAFPSQL